ncbi:MAG: hypothetical protein HY730_02750, partial [Candidatus Tectomicrobia bacterium]|nr:hypothetical protein [Candidatus Tectomicrobia bacterium]
KIRCDIPNIKIKLVDYLESKDNDLEKLRDEKLKEKYNFLKIMIPGIEYEGGGFISYLKTVGE